MLGWPAAYAYAYTYGDTYTDADANADGYTDAHADTDTDGDAYAGRNVYTVANSDGGDAGQPQCVRFDHVGAWLRDRRCKLEFVHRTAELHSCECDEREREYSGLHAGNIQSGNGNVHAAESVTSCRLHAEGICQDSLCSDPGAVSGSCIG